MVKQKLAIVFFLLYSLTLFANEQSEARVSKEELLTQKIESFLEEGVYRQNRAFIEIIFSPKEEFYISDRVDVVKVVQTLKDNGLLNLFFEKPQELTLSFATSGAPLFFCKDYG